MKRIENETQEDYRNRRKQTQIAIKNQLKGKWFFKSQYGDSYVAPKKESKPSFTRYLRNKKGYQAYLDQKVFSV